MSSKHSLPVTLRKGSSSRKRPPMRWHHLLRFRYSSLCPRGSRLGNEVFSSVKLLSTARTCIHLEVRPKMRSQLIVHCEFLTQGKNCSDREPTRDRLEAGIPFLHAGTKGCYLQLHKYRVDKEIMKSETGGQGSVPKHAEYWKIMTTTRTSRSTST